MNHLKQIGSTYDRSPSRDVDLHKVLPLVPRKWRGKEPRALIDVPVAAKVLAIGAEHDPVSTLLFDTNAVVGKAVRRVKVENPEEASPLKHNDLVAFMFQADISLRRMQPAVLLLHPLHLAVKVVQEVIPEQLIINEVELSPGVHEAVAVAFSGKVQPLGVAKLVAFKVQVAFAAEAMRDEANQLVKRETPRDDRRLLGYDRHVGVHLGIAQPEQQRLVADESIPC